jgi:hypothetical protein
MVNEHDVAELHTSVAVVKRPQITSYMPMRVESPPWPGLIIVTRLRAIVYDYQLSE